MDENLRGIWIFRELPGGRGDEICQIFSDGRALRVFKQLAPAENYLGMTVRLSGEGAGIYRVKTEATAVGYLIEIRRDGENLVIVNNHGLRSDWMQLPEDELPEYFAPVASQAVWR